MLSTVLHSALSTVFNLAFAAAPAFPLLGKKWPPEAAVKNIVLVHGAFTDGSEKDRMLPPAMEEFTARRMGAVTTTLPTCHMVILEEPAKVAAVIDQAAKGVKAGRYDAAGTIARSSSTT